jgi:hypothetical protein
MTLLRRSVFLVPALLVATAVPRRARADEPVVTVHETEQPAVTIRDFDPRTGETTTVVSNAHLDGRTYLSLGPLFSIVDSNTPPEVALGQTSAWSYALGLEASVTHYRGNHVLSFGYGAFVQTQLEELKYFRGDLGGQCNLGPGGVELGLGVRQSDGLFATTVSLHTALFVSMGYIALSYRVSPALFSFGSHLENFGLDSGVNIAIKLPLTIQGQDLTGAVWQPSWVK